MRVGRIGLGQPREHDPVPGLLLDVQQATMAREYASGLKDGFKIVLQLLLGEAAHGAQPYTGPVPDELRAWAEAALAKSEAV